MPKIRKVIDKSDSQVIDMGILPNVRFFGMLVGKTGASKTTLLINMLLNPEFGYDKIFKGDNIYIFSGSLNSDKKLEKLIDAKEIPQSNLYSEYDNDLLNALYDKLEEEYNERDMNDEPVEYPLIILDDLSFAMGRGKEFNALTRLAQNSRKLGISVLITTQHYSQIPLAVRNNISFAVLYATSSKNLAIIEEEHNYLKSKRQFLTMWKDNVIGKRDFIVVNYDNDKNDIYLNKEFEKIFN